MEPFAVLADPVRRRIVELLASGERAAGEVVGVVGPEFGISQSAVSQQLRVLREQRFARVRPVGTKRIYALEPAAVASVDAWLAAVRGFWADRLDDLAAEVEAHAPASAEPAVAAPLTTLHALGPITQIARTVRDVAESEAFYGHALALPHLYTFGTLAFFDLHGTRLMLSQQDPPAAESLLYFGVDDLDVAYRRLQDAGVAFRQAPHLVHRHADGREEWMAFFDDPEGRPLALHTVRAAGADGDAFADADQAGTA
jgi:DNA-binding transcriptional ArsR family regulator/extradiol dioxygenase family protein